METSGDRYRDYLSPDGGGASAAAERTDEFRDHVIIQPLDGLWIALWAGPEKPRGEFVGDHDAAVAWARARCGRLLIWDAALGRHVDEVDE